MRKSYLILALLLFIVTLPTVAKKKQKKEVGIQLYSVRERIGSQVGNKDGDIRPDYMPILQDLAKMGYTNIEAADYQNGLLYGRSPKEFKKDVEKAGLKVLSSHCNKHLSEQELSSGDFSESLKWWDDCIAAHKEAGMTYLVMPWLGLPNNLKDLKTYCDYFNIVGEKCKKQGIQFGYHNHAHEYQKVENKEKMLDFMIENTNPEYVFFEMDVYWTVIGKSSPVDYFKKYPGRFTVLHIKDDREVGQSGMVGFDAIFRNAETAGLKHYVVEMEGHTNGLEEGLKTSIDYLLAAPFVKASYSK